MENTQTLSNQNPTEAEIQPQQVSSNNSRLLVVVVISVLLTTMITGLVVYFWQRSANEKTINNLEQKITSLEKRVSVVKKIETTPQLISSPALSQPSTIDPTDLSKDLLPINNIFNDGNFYFVIPDELVLVKSFEEVGVPYVRFSTVSDSSIQIDLSSELELSCIEKKKETIITIDNLDVTKEEFKGVESGKFPNCVNDNQNFRAIWYRLPKKVENYGEFVLSVKYDVSDENLALDLLSQIFSTFKFID